MNVQFRPAPNDSASIDHVAKQRLEREAQFDRRPALLRTTTWLVTLLFTTIVAGSVVGKTEIVARGQGRAVPVDRTQPIQAQIVGALKEVRVREGDRVKVGDVLAVLDDTEYRNDIRTVESNMAQKRRERLAASAIVSVLGPGNGVDDLFVDNCLSAFGAMAAKEPSFDVAVETPIARDAFQSVRFQFLEAMEDLKQLQASSQTQAQILKGYEAESAILEERESATGPLMKSGAISRQTFLDRNRELATLRRNLGIARSQDAEAKTRLEVATDRLRRLREKTLADARKRANDDYDTKSLDEARLGSAKYRLAFTVIKAPVDGTVDNIKTALKSGFVAPGQQIMSIVPADAKLEFEAYFENKDAGFLEAGQKTVIQLDTFPAERYGYVSGRVLTVSRDARQIPDATGWFFAARIALDATEIHHDGKSFPFQAGMSGTADVITGERRLIGYFLEPVVKAMQDGMGER